MLILITSVPAKNKRSFFVHSTTRNASYVQAWIDPRNVADFPDWGQPWPLLDMLNACILRHYFDFGFHSYRKFHIYKGFFSI